MSDPVGFATGPWVVAFMIGCYASAALCLLFGVSGWLRKNDATQLVLFVLLGFFFFLESFGEIRIPFAGSSVKRSPCEASPPSGILASASLAGRP